FGFEEIGQLIKEYQVDKVVIGLPKNMNGTIGPRAEASMQYATEIENKFAVPTVLWDERLTTMAAERVLLEADVSRKKRKKVIDKMAAVMILQGYLNSKN
ncbi:MAG: Holliday junction resolvase RuvX, partial [Bacillus sp. (in: firmicutes)]